MLLNSVLNEAVLASASSGVPSLWPSLVPLSK